MYKPDRIDWAIISLLNEDGRMPSAEIARRLGDVSARTVTNRIEALTRAGIVSIRAVVDPETVGYCVLADVFIETETGRLREVAERVSEFPSVSYVACATGDTDVIISVRARDIEELFNIVNETLGVIPGVRRTQVYLLPLKLKDMFSWLPPSSLEDRVGDD